MTTSKQNGLCAVVVMILIEATGPAQQVDSNPLQTISVCELFKDLRSHAGQMVSVRGLLYRSSEISALGGECKEKFVTEYGPTLPLFPGVPEARSEYTWPTALDLAVSAHVERGEDPVLFQTDDEAIRTVYVQIASERVKLGEQESIIHVTVTGVLRIKGHYDVGKTGDGTLRGGGYGHLSAYPGQLVVKTMSDPVVELKEQ
jgi:hypothetical protein